MLHLAAKGGTRSGRRPKLSQRLPTDQRAPEREKGLVDVRPFVVADAEAAEAAKWEQELAEIKKTLQEVLKEAVSKPPASGFTSGKRLFRGNVSVLEHAASALHSSSGRQRDTQVLPLSERGRPP
jgi:hypothetical protein